MKKFLDIFRKVRFTDFLFAIICIILITFVYLDTSINRITHFTYNKHQYIRFQNIGVVHDPDCKYCFDLYD